MRARHWSLLSMTALCALAVGAIATGRIRLPDDWSPWATLDVAATPNLLTRFKLSRLGNDPDRCRAVLGRTQVDFEVLSDKETGPSCGLQDAVRIRRTGSDITPQFSLTCRTAVSMALWERHALQPAATRLLGQPVTRIEHFGSYSCRNVYGRPEGTRSRHATAEAWDVAGFVLADGRRIRVRADWAGDGVESQFLHAARDGACRFFDGVLSPDYNAAHRDHLHLDRGPYRVCR